MCGSRRAGCATARWSSDSSSARDDGWGEQQLPRLRIFPTDTEVGQLAGQFVAGLGRRLTPTGHDRNRTPTENPVPAPRKTVRLTHPLQPGCCAGRPQAQVDDRRSDSASVLLRHPAPPPRHLAQAESVPALSTVVFGTGDPNADLMFVGEGPGAEEDKQGLPFVGRSGKLLDELLVQEIGLDRAAV